MPKRFHHIRYRSKYGFDLFDDKITFSKTYSEDVETVQRYVENNHLNNYNRVYTVITHDTTELSVEGMSTKN